VVQDHLETFLSQAGETPDGGTAGGDGYPRFVEDQFRRYLDCGLLCHGFARLRCAECGYERLVAFSCKGKLRPSCLARRAPFGGRTADTAAWLVDRLLPEAGYRQWVLTFPWTMRFRLAADRRLLARCWECSCRRCSLGSAGAAGRWAFATARRGRWRSSKCLALP
jgi:hypothetical protein